MECPNDRYAMVRYYQRTDVCPNCGHSVSETIDWPPVNTTLLILKNQRAMMKGMVTILEDNGLPLSERDRFRGAVAATDAAIKELEGEER